MDPLAGLRGTGLYAEGVVFAGLVFVEALSFFDSFILQLGPWMLMMME